jgi:hypothetical protein
MGDPLDVSLDANSEFSSDQMTFYTHHLKMDALHYARFDVSSANPSD